MKMNLKVVFGIICLSATTALANVAVWVGSPGVSASTNWSDALNWTNSAGGSPGPVGNDAKFGVVGSATAAGSLTTVVDVNQNTLSLQFSNNTLAAPAQ